VSTATATKPTSKEIVQAKFPRATATGRIGGWEITETEDTFRSNLIGDGSDAPATNEQLIEGYDNSEDAAWDDAARNILAEEKCGALARKIVDDISFVIAPPQGDAADRMRWAVGKTARLIFDSVPQELTI
jgi:hypothetical protein